MHNFPYFKFVLSLAVLFVKVEHLKGVKEGKRDVQNKLQKDFTKQDVNYAYLSQMIVIDLIRCDRESYYYATAEILVPHF